MANSTFSGKIRSANGFQQITKNSTTGAVSESSFNIQTVATSGTDNIVESGTSVGANNASLGTAATIFNITPKAHGAGFPDDAINTFVNKVGGTITTNILIDLHGGASSGGGAGDAIGTAAAASCYIAEIDHSVNGVPMLVEFGCTEVPTGGDPDINLDCSATSTTAEDVGLTSGTNLLNNGDLTLGFYASADAGADLAAGKKFVFLTAGAATDAAYTAGKLWIRITGSAVDKANG